jgi:hypothetical protein
MDSYSIALRQFCSLVTLVVLVAVLVGVTL